ncbi:IQ domain-containing protein K isoform X2 [Pleurodeles waltl]|uniref:IQ domain-containing protein K isoform X2 n=1 Tax=Pleurodeles waltl TaxID=8319 RepID=UPI0037097409
MAADSVEAKRSAGDGGGSVTGKTSLAEQRSVGAEGSLPVQGNLEWNESISVYGSSGVESVLVEGSVVPKPLTLWEQICLEYELEQPTLPEVSTIAKQEGTSAYLESSKEPHFRLDQSQLASADFTCLIGQPPTQRLSVLPSSKTYFELEQTSSVEGSKTVKQFGTSASLEWSAGLHLEQSQLAPDLTSLTDQRVAELPSLPASKTYFQLYQPISSEGLKTDLQFGISNSLQSSADLRFRREQSQLAPADSTRLFPAASTRVGPEGLIRVTPPDSTRVTPADSTSVAPAGSTIVIDHPPQEPLPVLPDPKTCPTREYLETFIFPILLPGMDEMLREAHRQKCFEKKKTKFIALDFLTHWLYNSNQKRKGQQYTDFFQIPFVADWLKDHPRPPIPLSLLLKDEEAALIIQSFWRGYRVRCDPEVQELRQWQKDLRESIHIHEKVDEFWSKQETKVGIGMGVSEAEHIPNHSGVSIQVLSPTPQNTVILT